ncbi:DUF3427 domain-containing protein [Pectinatus frisingensis]|uniref:DUF3427 domain-containing protein n=1 Tax=Pectinatus frisingensis TaxID=865 RepID=UPI003D8024DD
MEEIIKAAAASLVDATIVSQEGLKVKLVNNDIKKGMSVIGCIEKLLDGCDYFRFAVAFITQSGLIMLKDSLKRLQINGVKGQILTTDYLAFNDPRTLAQINKLPNVTVRVYTKNNFHIKGYAFLASDKITYLIGSSNITQEAFKANQEWNIKFTCTSQGDLARKLNSEFAALWDAGQEISAEWLKLYQQKFLSLKKIYKMRQSISTDIDSIIRPNAMQMRVLTKIKKLYYDGKKKALLISATGTGKTFLSAFAIKESNSRHILFIAHREQILLQAEKSYREILGKIDTGFLSGSEKNISADYVFATINMLAKDDIMRQFSPTHFEYIIIDETHRAGAKSYQKVISYFRPRFMLGMTATPERTDDFDIYKLFDNNIAYEIRLQEAMQENLLCPFHYFGIADIEVAGMIVDDNTHFSNLVSEQRVQHIIEQAGFYGYSGERLRGLVFCRTVDEAAELSHKFNERGFCTIALSGIDTQGSRNDAISRLEQPKRQGGLDYIFSVDIFNEGVDIPAVNQIIMLRPTKSPIVFVQQLGRGLRKEKEKDYLVVLDFIGNYSNNFMIPIALFGDNSYNKDNMRRCISDGKNILYGPSTVNFDTIARKRIYEAIDKAHLNDVSLLKKAYEDLKNKLGKIPQINDFSYFGTIDIMRYWDKFGSYHAFLQKYEPNYNVALTGVQEEILQFICKRFARGKRIYEIELLQILLEGKEDIFTVLTAALAQQYHIGLPDTVKESVINNMTNVFTISNEREKYRHCVFIQQTDSKYVISDVFRACLKNKAFKNELIDVLAYARNNYQNNYYDTYAETDLCLYQKYTYEEVCWLLNWPHKINPNAMAGYFYEKNTRTIPVFINYIKADAKRVAYANKFLSDQRITAYSKLNRRIDSPDARHIYNADNENNRLFLFIRKPYEDKNTKEFYFLGDIHAIGRPVPAPRFNGFKIVYELMTPVREDIFDYLLS